MKSPLPSLEQESLRMKKIIKVSEIAYKESGRIWAEDAITGATRIISVSNNLSEAKSFLFG